MMGYDFHRQKPIDQFIADFFCQELMLAIELDGYSHNFEEVIRKDKIKERRLVELGINVMRFNDNEVMDDIVNVLRTIENYVLNWEETHPRLLSRRE